MNGLLCTEMFRLGALYADYAASDPRGLHIADALERIAADLADARDEAAQVIALERLLMLAETAETAYHDGRLTDVYRRLAMVPIPA